MQQPVRYQYIRGRHDAVVPHGLSEHFATERHVRRLAFGQQARPVTTTSARWAAPDNATGYSCETFPGGTPPRSTSKRIRCCRTHSSGVSTSHRRRTASHILGGFSISRIRNTNRGKLSCVSTLIYSKKFLSCLKFSLPDKRLLMRSFSAGKQR